MPEKNGYVFTGWYSDESLTDKISSIRLSSNKTVYAGWQEEQNTGVNPFSDVHLADWFYNDVIFIYERGLMLGTSTNTFSPYEMTTRGMMAQILWRLDGSPASKIENGCSDVAAESWYCDAITWTTENGIFQGYSKQQIFEPQEPISREQLAAILYRLQGLRHFQQERS